MQFWILLFIRVVIIGGDNVDHIYAREGADGSVPDRGRAIRAAIILNDFLCFFGFVLTAASIITASMDLLIPTIVMGCIGAYLDWRTIRTKMRLGTRSSPGGLWQRLANFLSLDVS